MRQLSIFALLAFSILACANSGESSTPLAAGPGEGLFKKYCAACHGLNGDMQINGAKNLNESVLSKAERVLLITNGRGMMTPFKGLLKPEEIEAVAAYTMRRFKKE